MKLTQKTIAIIGDPESREAKGLRTTLALALNFTERWVLQCIKVNKDNGPLTTETALQIIERSTKMKRVEILEGTALKGAA